MDPKVPKAQMSLERKHICRGTRSDASKTTFAKIFKGDMRYNTKAKCAKRSGALEKAD